MLSIFSTTLFSICFSNNCSWSILGILLTRRLTMIPPIWISHMFVAAIFSMPNLITMGTLETWFFATFSLFRPISSHHYSSFNVSSLHLQLLHDALLLVKLMHDILLDLELVPYAKFLHELVQNHYSSQWEKYVPLTLNGPFIFQNIIRIFHDYFITMI